MSGKITCDVLESYLKCRYKGHLKTMGEKGLSHDYEILLKESREQIRQAATAKLLACDALFTFLDHPAVPADNNGTERDIRSLAAARSDGGTHRADRSAAAFARLKSVIVTGMKNRVRFIRYGIEVVRAQLRGERLPLPLAAIPDTS